MLFRSQGYLEALRDGVITADRSTYESLHEEAERLVRLSRDLDALAEGDAGTTPPKLTPNTARGTILVRFISKSLPTRR